ncbi:MAG: LysM peptidoglycan-binding domain-containing protein [Candidatus Zixiibacteriota bacterium]
MKIGNSIGFLLISTLILGGCSSTLIRQGVDNRPRAGETVSSQSSQAKDSSAISTSVGSAQVSDTTDVINYVDRSSEIVPKDEFEEVEQNYALGVSANQEGKWLEAQDYFEQALELLANLDLDEEDSGREKRFQTLLNEIAEDYKITLLSLGVVNDESSISAFLERFESIENFKGLQKAVKEEIVLPPREVTYDIPIEWNERVENAIIYFQTAARKAFQNYMKRSGKYKDLMQKIIREKGLPEDIVWLCLVESGFNPKAYSWARALGPWQFIAGTGKIYGLKRCWWYDERRDFVKSTYAACDYLKTLYSMFNSWPLALAGYNGGEGNVGKAIKKHKTNDFWKLKMKKQTMDYVPLFMAATVIAKDPERYGFDIEYDEPLQFEEVKINQPLDLKKVARALGTSPEVIFELNPELLRGVTPPNVRGYNLRIPMGTKETFSQAFENYDAQASGLFVEHEVSKGQTLSYLSCKYGVPVSVIQEVNGLTNSNRLSVGQHLVIPANGSVAERNVKTSTNKAEKKSSGKFKYTVKKGDTLSKLAVKFNTTTREIKRLNGLKNSDYIRKGQSLTLASGGDSESSGLLKDHIVKRGETLGGVAEKYGVSISSIMSINNLSSAHLLKVGQHLLIPVSSDISMQSYTVKAGDTLTELAQRFQASTTEIKKTNALANADRLRAGQKLNIPMENSKIDKMSLSGEWITYVVKRGDTLWDIAKAFGIMLEKLMLWNDLGSHTNLQVGDRLKILLNQ